MLIANRIHFLLCATIKQNILFFLSMKYRIIFLCIVFSFIAACAPVVEDPSLSKIEENIAHESFVEEENISEEVDTMPEEIVENVPEEQVDGINLAAALGLAQSFSDRNSPRVQFIENLREQTPYYNMYTHETYALYMYSQTAFPSRQEIVEELAESKEEKQSADRYMVVHPQKGNLYELVKEKGNWKIDQWSMTRIQFSEGQELFIPHEQFQEYLTYASSYSLLVGQAIEVCAGLASKKFDAEKGECPYIFMSYVSDAYFKNPKSWATFVPLMGFISQLWRADEFDANKYMTQNTQEYFANVTIENREAFLDIFFANIAQVQTTGVNRFRYSGNADYIFYIVLDSGHLYVDAVPKSEITD